MSTEINLGVVVTPFQIIEEDAGKPYNRTKIAVVVNAINKILSEPDQRTMYRDPNVTHMLYNFNLEKLGLPLLSENEFQTAELYFKQYGWEAYPEYKSKDLFQVNVVSLAFLF